MFKKRSYLGIVLLLAVSMLLTACGPQRHATSSNTKNDKSGKSTTKTEAKVPSKPDSLLMWVNADPTQVKALRSEADAYTKKTGIKVNFQKVNMTDQAKKLAIAGPAGKGPDLFFQPHDRIGDLVTQGLAAPVDKYLSNDERAKYSKAAINAVTYSYKEPSLGDSKAQPHLYGFPQVIETYALFYNKDLVKKVPTTMDELMTQAKSLTNASQKKYGFLFQANNLYFAYPFFKNYGGYVFGGPAGGDATDIGLNNAGSIKGGEAIQKFFTEGLIPVSIKADLESGLFKSGKAAMVIDGPWAIPDYQKALGDKLGSAPIPSINGKPAQSFSGVKSWMLSYYSKNKYWAADLAKFLTNDKNSEHYYKVAGEMPPRPAVLDAISDPIYQGFSKQIKSATPMPNVPEMQQVWQPINDGLTFISKGKDVKSVLDDAVKKIKQQIKQSKQ